MTSSSDQVFSSVVAALRSDPDHDVTVRGVQLFVKDRLFAYLDDTLLVVDLAPERAADLVARDVAIELEDQAGSAGTRVAIADPEDWAELASEAHQFVGEPPVGKES